MKLNHILKDSNYKLTQFKQPLIDDLESQIIERESKGKVSYKVTCLIRGKEINLTPEEVIRQLYLRILMQEYYYPASRIQLEYSVSFGVEKKRADIAIMDKDRPETPYIIVELKKPKGRFNNSSDKVIREFIAERCRVLAVVGLHGNVFKPHTGTKTSVLFLQKWTDDRGICPKRNDYPIFFATMQKPSKDNSGEKIFVKQANGELLLDEHGHLIVDHDLFGHEGLTQAGIAEAFEQFALKEGLSFV